MPGEGTNDLFFFNYVLRFLTKQKCENWRILKLTRKFFYFRFTISGRTWKNAFGTEQGIGEHY